VKEKEIIYPETDGKPMAESDFQRKPLMYCVEALEAHFENEPQVYVSGDLLIYYDKEDPDKSIAPDVFVVFDVPKHARRTYKIWEEGKAPDMVIEILSKSTWRRDMGKKKNLYAQLGVKEYFLYDPVGDCMEKPLAGFWLDEDGEYKPIGLDELPGGILGIDSHLLRLELRVKDDELLLYDTSTKQYLYSYGEQRQGRLMAEIRAKSEAIRAESEARRAENEAKARMQADARAEAETQARMQADAKLRQTVQNMLTEGLPSEMVSRLTGLSISDIEKMKW
jgi:Uma2 family endonuclease